MVMVDNSCSRGRGFKSGPVFVYWMDIFPNDLLFKLYGLFEKRPKINEKKRPQLAHLKKVECSIGVKKYI